MATGLVLPAHNLSLDELTQSLACTQDIVDRVVIVHNDYPTADSDSICAFSKGEGVEILHFDGPIGKAEAVLRGVRVLLQDTNVALAVQVDGRAKQPPGEIEALIAVAKQTACEFVVANRYTSQNLVNQHHRRSSTTLWTQLVQITTGYYLRDTVSGMRVYSRRLAHAFLSEIVSYGYGLELAQLFVAARLGIKIIDVGVESKAQENHTSAEKIEDNVAVFLHESRNLTPEQRSALCQMMAGLKGRRTFVVDGTPFGLASFYLFQFVGPDEHKEDSYRVKGTGTSPGK